MKTSRFSRSNLFAYWVTRTFFLYPYYKLFFKVEVEGWAKIDWSKNYVIVSNHRSMQDPPLLAHATKTAVSFLAKKELFVNPFFSTLISVLGAIVLDREKPDASTMKLAREALRTWGWNTGIFIEGTRSQTDTLGEPHIGPIFVARMAKVPLLPVGIIYKAKRHFVIKFGQPYEVDKERGLEEQAWTCLEKISKLSGYKMPSR
jgi:1-acyl-sn-glycerol-3-phosphate acyltransferase